MAGIRDERGAVSMSWQIDIHITQAPDGGPVLVVEGDLDDCTSSVLESLVDTALDGSEGALTVDLSRLRFLDSYGVRALARARQQTRGRGRGLVLQGANARTRRLLELLGWDSPPQLMSTG